MASNRSGQGERRGRSARGQGRSGAAERLTGLHPIREALAARRRALFRLLVAEEAEHPGIAPLQEAARQAGVEVEVRGASRVAVWRRRGSHWR